MFDGLRIHASGDRAKAYRGGTHRTVEPAETVARLRPWFQRLGITRLGEITGLDRIGLPVTQAIRPIARSLSVSQGKGRSLDEALASAAMEAAEKWHAERARATADGTPAELRAGGRIVELADVAARSGEADAHDGTAVHWVEGRDMVTGAPVMVPLDCVAMDYSVPPDSGVVARSSNGLASGNSWPEALAAALLELIERDGIARLRELGRAERDARRLRRSCLRNGPLEREVRAIEEAGLWLEVWDLTSGLGVPAFEARVFDRGRSSSIYRLPATGGSGAHLDPVVALSRAVLEAVQSRLTLIAGSRDDIRAEEYVVHPAESAARIGSALFADDGARRFDPRDLSGDSSLEDVDRICRALVENGLDLVAAVDLTDPEIGLPVLRAVVPGLAVVSGPETYRRGRPMGDVRLVA